MSEVRCHHGKTMLEELPDRTCGPMGKGDPVGAGLVTGLVPEGLYPMERTHVGAVWKELQPVGRTHVGVHGTLSPVTGTLGWRRVSCEESSL